ncbi:vWA domain-containing protein [Bremerella sp. JC817]|uniref:vWA domain-containing protein n=1 Tax=Bremerella sp. JC817 TaxID=3231756 RepID=UPI003458B004
MVALFAALGVGLLVALAEGLHLRRVNKIRILAFGPTGRPQRWAQAAPALRVLALSLSTWGLVTLLLIEPLSGGNSLIETERKQHLIVLLDVSPSMDLPDAGVDGKQTRKARGKELLESIFQRTVVHNFKTSVFAVYTDAFAVVEETTDPEVISNILDDLPMYSVFQNGKTNLFSGLEKAAELASRWEADSTSIIIVSDGDTVPATGMPRMPPSVSQILVLGVGDTASGTFIDGHQSRQDVSTLNHTAIRLGGHYHNGNSQHLETSLARSIMAVPEAKPFEYLTMREYAMLAIGLGSLLLATLPVLLDWFGTEWSPGQRHPRPFRRKEMATVSARSAASPEVGLARRELL